MKKLLILFVFTIVVNFSFAQLNLSYVCDTLDINNWQVSIYDNNSNFWNMTAGSPAAIIPKGSQHTPLFNSNIWVGGYDNNNILHLAADRYFLSGASFTPGPYANVYDSAFYVKYNRVWKINRSEITYHINHYNQPGYVMPEAIENWPGNGNSANGEGNILAPFVDFNLNGIYDPQNGDYPYIRGDQAIYYILNDKADTNTALNADPLGLEIHVMAYAFQATGVINNTFFMHFDILNKSTKTYNNVLFGINSDIDLGAANDDYIGCDTTQNLFFGYNGDSVDGSGEYWAYGAYPPAIGIQFSTRRMTSFMYYTSAYTSEMNDPATANEYYNLMHSLWKDSTHLVHHSKGHDASATDTCNFAYPEYSNWTEITENNYPVDKRAVGAVSLNSFQSYSCYTMDIAYVWARDTTDLNPHASVDLLLSQTPQVKQFASQLNMDTTCAYLSGIHLPKKMNHIFKIYPNPATNEINIDTKLNKFKAKIFTLNGRTILETENTKTIDVSKIRTGVYFIDITDGKILDRRKFVIQ